MRLTKTLILASYLLLSHGGPIGIHWVSAPAVARVAIQIPVIPGDTDTHIDMQMGSATTIAAQPFDSAGNPLTGRTTYWTSKDTAIAIIGRTNGRLVAKRRGTSTITARIGGRQTSTTLCVSEHNRELLAAVIVSRVIVPGTSRLAAGSTVQETFDDQYKASGFLAKCVHWSIPDSVKAFASVNRSGLLRATRSVPITSSIGPSIPQPEDQQR